MIGGLTPERAAQIPELVAEKSKLRDGLRRTWKEKFEALKKLREEQVKEQETMTRLKAAGKLNLSDKDMAEAYESNQDKLDAAIRDAQNYLDDASELDREIEELNAELADKGN